MSKKVVLTGDLEFLNLGDLLQMLGTNNSTGILTLTSKYAPHPGKIYLKEGAPINGVNAKLEGMEALNSLFGWIDAEFSFSREDVTTTPAIKKSRMQIILDALSMLDDGEIEKLCPIQSEGKGTSDKKESIPLVKGPMADYMYIVDEEEFLDGHRIISEGKHGGWLWVILSGIIEINKDHEGESIPILRLGEGAYLGSLKNLVTQGPGRTASALAVGDVQLGVIDAQRIINEFALISENLQDLFFSLERRLAQSTGFAVNALFGENNLKSELQDKKLAIRQGKDENRLFKITNGEAMVVHNTENANLPLAKLGSGDYFGRLPFADVGHEPESASVYVSKDLKYNKLDANVLNYEFIDLSTTLKNIIDSLAHCQIVTTYIASKFHRKRIQGLSVPVRK